MILTRTPYRVSLFGGGTDYPEWFKHNHGAVVGMAIDKYCYVGVKHMPPGQELSPGNPLRYRVQYSKVNDCGSVDEIQHPAVRAALQYYKIDTPLEFHVFGDLPGRSGLGGSSSFSVGLLHALQLLFKMPMASDTGLQLAQEATILERDVIKEAVGFQDQVFAACGGLNKITFSDTTKIHPLGLAPEREKILTDSLVLVYSGGMRDSHVLAAKQISNVPKNTIQLDAMHEQVLEAVYLLTTNSEDTLSRNLGRMLHSAWQLKQKLHPDISTEQINTVYADGLYCGAYGGKLLGAGGGGFMLFCVEPSLMEGFILQMAKLNHNHCVRFGVDYNGSVPLVTE